MGPRRGAGYGVETMKRKILWAGVTSGIEIDIWRAGKGNRFGDVVTRNARTEKIRSVRIVLEVDE